MGVMMVPIVELAMPQIHQNILIVLGIMVILSLIAFFDTNNTFSPFLKYLIVALFVLVVVELSHLFFYPESYHTWSQVYDIVVILMFCFIVLADTQNLRQKAVQCGRSACIDYPSESTKIFLDILNLFARVSSSRSKR
jgi:FtsH-binding integral membrane protein